METANLPSVVSLGLKQAAQLDQCKNFVPTSYTVDVGQSLFTKPLKPENLDQIQTHSVNERPTEMLVNATLGMSQAQRRQGAIIASPVRQESTSQTWRTATVPRSARQMQTASLGPLASTNVSAYLCFMQCSIKS